MTACKLQPFEDAPPDQVPVRGFLHIPQTPSGHSIVLTHGAGANCGSALLTALAEAFCEAGLVVLRCDLPFRQARPHGPPPRGSAQRDQQGLRRAVECLKQFAPKRVFMGGHSYGGRQASMLAAAEPGLVDGLVLLSYPLHPPRRREELRTAHFPSLRTPALFIHGTRDGFGSLAELEDVVRLVPGETDVVAVPGAGHELLTKQNRDTLPGLVVKRFGAMCGV